MDASRRAIWRAWLVFLGAALASGAVRADDGPASLGVVVLPAAGLQDPARQRLEADLLSAALAHSGAGFAWRLTAFSTTAAGLDESAELRELTRLVEAGKKAYRYLKLDEAQKLFEQAAGLLERRPLLGCAAPQVAQLYLYWARAVLDSGDGAGAQALLAQVPRFDPKAVPDPALMPPNLVATFDLALDERRGRSRGQVLFQSGPGRASLRLDCQAQSAGVVQWNGVAGDGLWLAAEVEGGTLRLRLTLPEGPRRELHVWSGQPGSRAALRAQASAVARSPAPLGVAGATSAELDGLAGVVGVGMLLVAEPVKGGGLRLGLYAAGRGPLGEPLAVAPTASGRPDPDALVQAVAELAGRARARAEAVAAAEPPAEPAPGPAAAPEAPPGALPPGSREEAAAEEATPWYETWWFWTAAGGAIAAGLVVGLAVGLGGASEPSGDVVITLGR